MHILMIASENDAIKGGKVGGVGDVLRDVPPALIKQGHQVDVILPDYGQEHAIYKQKIAEFAVPFGETMEPITLYQLSGEKYKARGERLFLISHPLTLSQNGQIYCTHDEHGPFAQDATKFALFNAAICEALIKQYIRMPDILHLHDWHSACVSLLRRYDPRYQCLQEIPCIYTVHNIALQGIRPFQGHFSSLNAWFPTLNYEYNQVVDPRYQDCFNPMRAGIRLSDRVHLVSPSYVDEVIKESRPEEGFFGGEGLEHDLLEKQRQGATHGILNGCDYPENKSKKPTKAKLFSQIQEAIATWMPNHFQLRSVDYLANERAKLWQQANKGGLLMTSIGRLTDQKVLLLKQIHQDRPALSHILEDLKAHNGRFILLGSGDHELETFFTQMMGKHDNFLFINGYGHELSESLYQYGDLFFMPSSFEPCGISQMLALRAGQPCLVHGVGGLKDTIKHQHNGFVFFGENLKQQVENMLDMTKVAICQYDQSKMWQNMRIAAKESRFKWSASVQDYIQKLYQPLPKEDKNKGIKKHKREMVSSL